MSRSHPAKFRRVTILISMLMMALLFAFPAHIRDRIDDFPQSILTRNSSDFVDQISKMMEPLGIERGFNALRKRVTEILFGV